MRVVPILAIAVAVLIALLLYRETTTTRHVVCTKVVEVGGQVQTEGDGDEADAPAASRDTLDKIALQQADLVVWQNKTQRARAEYDQLVIKANELRSEEFTRKEAELAALQEETERARRELELVVSRTDDLRSEEKTLKARMVAEEARVAEAQAGTPVSQRATCCVVPTFKHVLLGLASLTSPNQFVRRNNMRKTFGKTCNSQNDCSMFFFVTGLGAADDPVMIEEFGIYHDIVYLPVANWHDDHLGHLWWFNMFNYLVKRSRLELSEDFYADYWMWVDSDTYVCVDHLLAQLGREELPAQRTVVAHMYFKSGILWFDGPGILISGDWVRWWFSKKFLPNLLCGMGGYDHGLGFWIMQYYREHQSETYFIHYEDMGLSSRPSMPTETLCTSRIWVHGFKDQMMLMLHAHMEWPEKYPRRPMIKKMDLSASMKTLNTSLTCNNPDEEQCQYWLGYIDRANMVPCISFPAPTENMEPKTGTLTDNNYHCNCVGYDKRPNEPTNSPSPTFVPNCP